MTVYQALATTTTSCSTVSACTATSTTSTTTVVAACTLSPNNLGIDTSGYNYAPLGDSQGDGWADEIDTVTATVATLVVTMTFGAGDPASSIFGATATFDMGIDAFNSETLTQTTTTTTAPPSSTPPPGSGTGGHGCPLGWPLQQDCLSLIFADSSLPQNQRIPAPKACFSGTTNNAQWQWCDFATQGTCQISLAWRLDQGPNPFLEKGWPTGLEFNGHVGNIWAQAAGCNSGIQAFVDTDVGLGTYYVCIKQTGFNCWVSI